MEPRKGQWDMRQKQFHEGVEVHKWAIIVFTEEAHCDNETIRCVGVGVGVGVSVCV